MTWSDRVERLMAERDKAEAQREELRQRINELLSPYERCDICAEAFPWSVLTVLPDRNNMAICAVCQRDGLKTALEKLLPLAAQAWAKHDADATEYYIATRDAGLAIADAKGESARVIECNKAEVQRDALLDVLLAVINERECDCGVDYQCEICHSHIVIAKMRGYSGKQCHVCERWDYEDKIGCPECDANLQQRVE